MKPKKPKKPMKALAFLDYFTPAFKAGGPIRVFEAAASASSPDHALAIVTQDHDWGESEPLVGIVRNQWLDFSSARVFYTSAENQGFFSIRKLLRSERPDVVHLNSLFSRTWTLKILLLRRFGLTFGIRILLSPHGELAPSALAIKPLRKRVFVAFGKIFGLFNGLTWIATAAKEVDEIKSVFGNDVRVLISVPPPPSPIVHDRFMKKAGELKIVFLARISAMKNIGLIFDLLPKIEGKITFHVYGPIDPAYESTWREISSRIPSIASAAIEYLGPVASDKSVATLALYDLFVQPSLSENFGFSILEALAAGTPVLISDRTPWNEVTAARIGTAISLDDIVGWRRALQGFVDMDESEWQQWSERAHTWIRDRAQKSSDLLKIYEEI